ncbi:transcriptional regulator [Scytonema hofmannii PCC 7110]|uniref:Transcriptional regulator n=1 Tax=Scytonema hofmannii PCC 7110 TaxID=128403 RepID=A0A139X5Q0_9CYAN|nr:LysR family transcriptional regulator [Scytonema hofmannii]KYC40028.1 transcriptional regulator [Scytonema hofmannii PCC 7110]
MDKINDCNLKISQLRALVAVGDRKSFSEAALELGLSQSTVSYAIATLEEELGVILVLRGRHGATLTPIGETIFEEAQQILRLLGNVLEKAEREKGLQSGQVRVACVRSIATHVLPKVIARFREKYPMMGVVITEYDRYAEVEQALQQGQAEVGFTLLPTGKQFEAWELFRDEFVALLSPGVLASNVPLSWEQLAEYPMIVNLRSPQHNKVIQEHFLQFGQTLKVDRKVREDSTVLSMVKQGLGATVMARLTAEPIPQEIQVRSLPVPLERIIGVIILADAILPKRVFAFLDVLKQGCLLSQKAVKSDSLGYKKIDGR